MHRLTQRRRSSVAFLAMVLVPWQLSAEETETFSRSAWIEHNLQRGVEFSGGVIPKGDWRPSDAPEILPIQAKANARKTRRPRRVNKDLLDLENHPQPGTQAEPYLHVSPTQPKHLIAGWQENRYEDGGAQALNVAVSFDGGRTWSESLLPGVTLVSGGPWEDPVEVFVSSLDFNDKEALTVDTSLESPFRGRVYVAWDINIADATGQNTVSQDLVIARSEDGGESFKNPRRLRSNSTNIGAIPRVGRDGTVYVVWAGRRGGDFTLRIYSSRSGNGGRRWSSPQVIATLGSQGVPDIRSGDILPSFAIDPVTGDQYVVWQDSR